MKKIDYLVSAIFLICITILFFLGTCRWDKWVLILGVAVVAVVVAIIVKQTKKYNELEEELEEYESRLDK